jgi:NAD(P)H-hydrate repair Nnr-like enzyme with NAD(P)H-hydrate dehydratase domain
MSHIRGSRRAAGLATLLFLATLLLGTGVATAGVAEDIDEATAAGHPVFVVVTDRDANGFDRAFDIAKRAQALAPGARLATLDRGAAENKDLVRRYGVLGAPVPLLLVVAQNGVVAGGAMLKDATPEVLVGLIPTPKKAEMLLALSKQLPVFVFATGPDMEGSEAMLAALKEAHRLLEKRVATVGIDVRDEAEKAFLKELGIDPKTKHPVIVVFNAKGQKSAAFRDGVTAAQLVEAARKKASCCPGGSC